MRIGINVPNELLQRVKQIRPELNVSQVCRDALEYRASVIERAGTQAALDGVDHYVDRLDQSVKKPLVEPDWVAYALEDARDWVRTVTPEWWNTFVDERDSLRRQGQNEAEMIDVWSQSTEGVKGYWDRIIANREWFTQQYKIQIASGIGSHLDMEQRAKEEYGQAWLGYVNEVERLLAMRRREQLDVLMAERAEHRRSLPKPELLPKIEDIQQAILNLSKAEYIQLRRWLSELDWEEWDQQIEADSADGKLDFLIAEAAEAKQRGTLETL